MTSNGHYERKSGSNRKHQESGSVNEPTKVKTRQAAHPKAQVPVPGVLTLFANPSAQASRNLCADPFGEHHRHQPIWRNPNVGFIRILRPIEKGMRMNYRCIHKRYNDQNTLFRHDVVTLCGNTLKAVKDRAEQCFGLHDWNGWACTAKGTHQRTHTPSPECPYRGVLTLEPLKE